MIRMLQLPLPVLLITTLHPSSNLIADDPLPLVSLEEFCAEIESWRDEESIQELWTTVFQVHENELARELDNALDLVWEWCVQKRWAWEPRYDEARRRAWTVLRMCRIAKIEAANDVVKRHFCRISPRDGVPDLASRDSGYFGSLDNSMARYLAAVATTPEQIAELCRLLRTGHRMVVMGVIHEAGAYDHPELVREFHALLASKPRRDELLSQWSLGNLSFVLSSRKKWPTFKRDQRIKFFTEHVWALYEATSERGIFIPTYLRSRWLWQKIESLTSDELLNLLDEVQKARMVAKILSRVRDEDPEVLIELLEDHELSKKIEFKDMDQGEVSDLVHALRHTKATAELSISVHRMARKERRLLRSHIEYAQDRSALEPFLEHFSADIRSRLEFED